MLDCKEKFIKREVGRKYCKDCDDEIKDSVIEHRIRECRVRRDLRTELQREEIEKLNIYNELEVKNWLIEELKGEKGTKFIEAFE